MFLRREIMIFAAMIDVMQFFAGQLMMIIEAAVK